MKLTLPSGQRVSLDGVDKPQRDDVLFADALALRITPGSVRDLALADFHVLRAVATKQKLFEEDAIEVDCMNCGEPIEVRPCSLLEIGPWVDGELDDPELDQLLVDERFEALTVKQALPLFKALAARRFDIDETVVKAMGLRSMTPDFLADCDDETFDEITSAWLDAHYVPRLAGEVICAKCNARNTVDAPYLREFDRGRGDVAGSALPPLAEFVELAHAIGDPLLDTTPEPPELIVEEGTPAVDDGGVPLLGSYVPPPPKDAPVPMGPGTVTIYYRTFVAMAKDEPGWDWEDELRETIEHELEHHVFFLRGDDPMDDEERAEIARDAVRVVGRSESTRRALGGFGASVPDFFRRAWPLVLLAAVVLAITIAEARCSD